MPATYQLSTKRGSFVTTVNTAAKLILGCVLPILVAAPLSARDGTATCSDCHDEQPDVAAFGESVHGFLACVDCHSGAEDLPHPDGVAETDCAMCHEGTVEEYAGSAHGLSRENGSAEAPDCTACHGDIHLLVPAVDPASPVHPVRLPETCGACHSDPEVVAKFGIPVARPIEAFEASVHAQMGREGAEAASCNSCHGSHAIYSAADHRSMVHHLNVPRTCSQCHEEIGAAYAGSVHGTAAAHGAREAPVCTDCHGEHRILSPRERGSPVYAANIPKMTCGRCHSDLRLAEKFGIKSNAVPAYEDSYHGLASRAGAVTVAHCGSCHGVHDILPSSDPRSHIHPDNLGQTCGSCHPGARAAFAFAKVHVLPTEREHTAVFWVRRVYLWLIYLIIGGMVLHNLLDLRRKMRRPPPRHEDAPADAPLRMSRGFRVAHWLMMGSFIVLAYTGFALKYPEAWWARPLLIWWEGFGLRGWLHRTAALVMLGALALHVAHLAVDRSARACIKRMRPNLHDVTELRQRVAWFFGRRPDPPRSPRLGYPEKLEYIALMWGLLIMTVTGFALWFENLVLAWLPQWVSNVATVIHFYEAVLATLAILVWHMYFVVFDPVVYPMDAAWLHGREHPGRHAERRHDRRAPRAKAPSRPRPKTENPPRASDESRAVP